jgi:hypothetical protein
MEQVNNIHKNYDVGRKYGLFATGLYLWLCVILLIFEFVLAEE